jgi:GTP pyrophosphokinase
MGAKGQPFEVQIRTRDMDLVAEDGIAAHWRYKEGKAAPEGFDRNVRWLRQLLEIQTEQSDPRSFLSSLKLDLYPDEVYVFTPKGDVYSFPRDATPLDFAYRIHTDLGHHCTGARLNGRLVPLRTPLKTGDIVEILTSAARAPSRDWLNLVVTSRAKSKIRHWLNTQQTEQAIQVGRRLLEKELQRLGLPPRKTLESDRMRKFLTEEGLARPEDLLARIGYGKATVAQVTARILTEEELAAPPEAPPGPIRRAINRLMPASGQGPIAVHGRGDVLTVLARCCRPVPGDEIVGYITRGRGISVHSVDCPNVRNLLYNPEREIEVTWAKEDGGLYPVSFVIETEDRRGMLARLTEAIAKLDTNIRQIEADTERPGRGNIEVVVEVRNRSHLDRIRRALGGLPGVLEVARRMTGSSRVGQSGE